MREKVAHRDIILEHISTSIQSANIFTKGHMIDRFCFLHDKLAIYDLPASLMIIQIFKKTQVSELCFRVYLQRLYPIFECL